MAQLSLAELFPSAFMNESSLQKSLGEEFSLCDSGNMVFHWADFHETCDAVKKALDENPEMREEFRRKEVGLSRLDLIPVWIKTQSKVYQATMFDLYERYILDQTEVHLGVDPFGPLDISFISGTGPFRSLAIAECFNKSTYRDFVMVYLLKGKLPKRNFRIRLKSKILMEYGNQFEKAHLIELEQLTMNGLLLSLDSDFFVNEISRQENLRLLIDTQVLAQGSKKNLEELKSHLSHYAFNLMYSSRKEDSVTCKLSEFHVQSSFDFLRNRRVYLFASYAKLAAGNPASVKDIEGFVEHSKNLIREHYNFHAKAKTA